MNDTQIFEEVRQNLTSNIVEGTTRDHQHYLYIKPAKGRYPYQYFWDTCFHIFILSALEEYELARANIRNLVKLQSENGFIGHILYWNHYLPTGIILPPRITDILQNKISLKSRLLGPHMSALIQPPLLAHAILHYYHSSHDLEFVAEMLPASKKFYDYLIKDRIIDDSGLLTTVTTFESGMDWKPSYDPVVGFPHGQANWQLFAKVIALDFKNFKNDYQMEKIVADGEFLVKDAGLNTIFVENLRSLAALCSLVNDPDEQKYKLAAEKGTKSIMDLMYDEQRMAFLDVHGLENKKIDILTATIFFPILIEEMDEQLCKKILDRHFFNKEEFNTPYPIPSVAVNDPSFNPKESMYIWRGPTWIVFNWFLHKYFLKKGFEEEAERLITGFRDLIVKSGFREYYNPFTGEGYGAHNFTWSGLITDMINKHKGELHTNA